MASSLSGKSSHKAGADHRSSDGISVFVIDEQPIIASGIFSYFSSSREFSVCGQSHFTDDALKGIAVTRPKVIISDLQLRRGDGLAWVRDLSMRFPSAKIVVFTTMESTVYALRAIRSGAHGYVSKYDDPAEILKALRAVCRGEIYLPTTQMQDLIRESAQGEMEARPDGNPKNLGDRELHVLKLVGAGYSTHEVSKAMHISHKTVQTHRRNIMIKLGIFNTNRLVSFAAQWMRDQSF